MADFVVLKLNVFVNKIREESFISMCRVDPLKELIKNDT